MSNTYLQLFHDAADGLTEYFHFLQYHEFRQMIGSNIYPSYKETGNNQSDYENLRDLIEVESNNIQQQLQEYVVIPADNGGYCYGKDVADKFMEWFDGYETSGAAWFAAYQDSKK